MGKGRKVSSISKEFDGKEVQGKLIERAGLFGSKMSKEVFKMPSGGKHIEKTRTNKKGDVVSRMSRDTKVNPLKVFNDNKEKAYKKAGGEMAMFKKSLKRADNGIQMGPMTRESNPDSVSTTPNQPVVTSPSNQQRIMTNTQTPGGFNKVVGGTDQFVKRGGAIKPTYKKGGPVKRKK